MKLTASFLTLALATPLVQGLTLLNATHPYGKTRVYKRYLDWRTEICPTGLSDCMTNYDSLFPVQTYTTTPITNDYTSCTDRPTCCAGSDTSCQNSPAAIGAKVYRVNFADSTTATVCICPNNAMTLADAASRIGQVPKAIRAHVLSYKVANQANQDASGAVAYADAQRLTFFYDSGLSVVMHEIFHTFDSHFNIGTPNNWGPAAFADTCIPDYYAKSSRAEHVAQVGVVYTYLSKSVSNWNSAVRGNGCQDNTLKLLSSYLNDTIPPPAAFTGIRAPIPPPGAPAPATVTLSGYRYNLTSLASPLVFTGGLGTYYVSLASYLPLTVPCSDGFAGACLQETWGALTTLGYPNDYTYALANTAAPSTGVKLTYRGGDSCGGTIGNRTTVVNFKCGTGTTLYNFVTENPTCTYQLEVVGPAGCGVAVGTTTTTTITTTTTTTTTTTIPTGACAPHYGQCGGSSWTGAKCCQAPWTCTASNQCK
ncbi:hypothetical protein HK097_002660 [Rhizophlyctis rosea]|uniref:CBM1 domain-containing protein n=1 Tax=Rhizophlyctis rosea TaxID=64517 RepID=A0AAD5X124_9FUNG|nr:hypothetical protein HK097_002660 [Rhizophlyctis rosea]